LIYVLWSYNAIKQHLYFHTLLNFDCLTYNCLCKQPKDYQGLSQLKTQQGWFLLIDLPKDLEQHRVVHKCFSCIYSPPLFNSYCFQWFVCTAQYFVITVIWSSQQCIVGSIYISPWNAYFESLDLFKYMEWKKKGMNVEFLSTRLVILFFPPGHTLK
jgi:hypothetical protein